jgi:hypothetical protein
MGAFDKKNAMIFCKLYRFGNDWRFLAIGEPEVAQNPGALKSLMAKYADPMYEPIVHKINKKKNSISKSSKKSIHSSSHKKSNK